ncbi:conserved hypothetical protein [Bradyrhizobium sp. STM 3809]|nr:conserved hypothetical protein [Bradyrhizobium sp. STM 3809]
MPGLDPAIHVSPSVVPKVMDGRVKPGHDGGVWGWLCALELDP